MIANPGQVHAQSKTRPTGLDIAAVDHAVRLTHQVCCLAGSFDLLEEFRDPALCAAVERHDTAALFDRLIYDFSFQGISDEIAANYIAKHGQATWGSVHKNLERQQKCPKLKPIGIFTTAARRRRAAPAPSPTISRPARCQPIA
jgi:hypothetical protein